jgi:hypothetical protein
MLFSSLYFILYFYSNILYFISFCTVEPSLHRSSVIGRTVEGKGEAGEDEEPSQMSLADRVRLFNRKIEVDSRAPLVVKQPAPTRRRVAQMARFKTQPVTTEEVETAARWISPLAASLAKPPDPTLLGATLAVTHARRIQQY